MPDNNPGLNHKRYQTTHFNMGKEPRPSQEEITYLGNASGRPRKQENLEEKIWALFIIFQVRDDAYAFAKFLRPGSPAANDTHTAINEELYKKQSDHI